MKTVAYSCPFVPPEWIAAHGLRPRLLVPRSLGTGAAAGPTAGVCAFARAAAQAAIAEKDIDAYVATSLCDQRRRAMELAGRQSKKPIFMLHVPAACQAPKVEKLYAAELQRLGQFLVRLGGKEPSRSELAGSILAYSLARAKLAARAASVNARQAAEAFWSLGENGPDPKSKPWLSRMHLDDHIVHPGVPILLLGSPLTREGLVVLDLVEQAGGRVTVNATENGPAIVPGSFHVLQRRASLLDQLVRAYYRHIPHPFSRPNDRLYEWLADALKTSQARGILFIRYVWCDLWHAELARLKERCGVPVVDVDLTAGDDTVARLAGRVQALMEMLA
jgi:benzoyl-CoA reductase/2-hydroxyglutaryl-CoA dehydratase subunit BcrC/BadD/HgdB